MRFKEYLIEQQDTKNIKPPAPRPKKTLWFDEYENWAHDVQLNHPDIEAYNTSDEQIIALNNTEDKCFGRWDPITQKGVSFDKPRTLMSVIGKNVLINRVLDTNEILRKSIHQ